MKQCIRRKLIGVGEQMTFPFAPFAWTKKKVHQRRFKNRRITQL
jgi:hypothetical protein